MSALNIEFVSSAKNSDIALKPHYLRIDGEDVLLKGVCYSPYMPGENPLDGPPTLVNVKRDFRWMKQAGINVIRSYAPLQDHILDIAESFDLYVIEGINISPGGGQFRDFWEPRYNQESKNLLINTIEMHKDHENIIMWCIGNELDCGVIQKVGVPAARSFLLDLYRTAKTLDNTRPITHALPPWEDWLELPFFDVISFNVYSFQTQMNYLDYLVFLRKKYKEKPFLISEFGLSTSTGSLWKGYGGKSESDQVREVHDRWYDILKAGCIGGLAFEWNDEWWKNNLFERGENVHDRSDPEEWFGVIGIDGDIDSYLIRKKPVYYKMKTLFSKSSIDSGVLCLDFREN